MGAENQSFAATEEYECVKQHTHESGLIQVPLATDDGTPSCEVIRLHNPIERLTVHWSATKIGAPPLVPHPTLFSSNHTFLHGVRTIAVPAIDGQASAEGASYRNAVLTAVASKSQLTYQKTGNEAKFTRTWSMSGIYYYSVGTVMGLGSAFTAGKMPFDNIAIVDTVVPASNFKQGIYEEETVFMYPLQG